MSSRAKALVVAALGFLTASAAAEVKPDDAFPPLAAADFDGALPATGGRVVLVDFWASWCAPCRASFAAYGRLQADFAARGLVIVAVSVDESAPAYGAFVRKMQPSFATVRDRAQKLVRAIDVPTMPSSYLLGRDGIVRFVHAGFYGERTERALRREIELLLAEKGPPA